MASAMGTGIFNLPLRVQEVGLLAFILYVILAVIFSYSGAIMLARMIKAKGFNSYSDMSETAFGKILKGLSQFCLILYPWGIAVCFQVILTKFIIQLLADNFGLNFYDNRDDEIYNTTGKPSIIQEIWFGLASMSLLLPLTFSSLFRKKSVSSKSSAFWVLFLLPLTLLQYLFYC